MAFSQLINSSTNALAADARSLNTLKLQAGQNTPASIKEAARQFESLFMRELIKSMREATMKSGMLDSAGGDLGQDLLDQQLAVQMSGLPGGLSDMITRQLLAQTAPAAGPAAAPAMPQVQRAPGPVSEEPLGATRSGVAQSLFVSRHAQTAQRVEQSSGIPSAFMLGQAGHETGWGRREITLPGGAPSFNLFGIKAGAAWRGKVAEVPTTEFVDGVPKTVLARFRAYGSYEESFRDYARLITQSPRYAQASQQTTSVQAYANGLQRAGYATDPDYASKLSRAINSTLQLQRARA